MLKNEEILRDFAQIAKNQSDYEKFKQAAEFRRNNINQLMYNETSLEWQDYIYGEKKSQQSFYISNWAALWD